MKAGEFSTATATAIVVVAAMAVPLEHEAQAATSFQEVVVYQAASVSARPEVSPFEGRLFELMSMTREPNWNDEGDAAIPGEEWIAARDFVRYAQSLLENCSEPFVSPCGDGSIHLSWKRADGGRLTIERKGGVSIWRQRLPAGASTSGRCENPEALRFLGQFLSG
jgi:hypothetical protein